MAVIEMHTSTTLTEVNYLVGTSATRSYGFTTTAGRLLVHFVACKASGNPSMADTSWIRCMPKPASGRVGVWYKIADGTETELTYSMDVTSSSVSILVECLGADTATALDVVSEASGVGTALDTGPPSHPPAPDSQGMAYAFFTNTDNAVGWNTPGGGFTTYTNGSTTNGSPNVAWMFMYKQLASNEGPLQATIQNSTSSTWQAVLVTFKVPLPPNLPAPMQSVG